MKFSRKFIKLIQVNLIIIVPVICEQKTQNSHFNTCYSAGKYGQPSSEFRGIGHGDWNLPTNESSKSCIRHLDVQWQFRDPDTKMDEPGMPTVLDDDRRRWRATRLRAIEENKPTRFWHLQIQNMYRPRLTPVLPPTDNVSDNQYIHRGICTIFAVSNSLPLHAAWLRLFQTQHGQTWYYSKHRHILHIWDSCDNLYTRCSENMSTFLFCCSFNKCWSISTTFGAQYT